MFVSKARRQAEALGRARDKVAATVSEHLPTLGRRRMMLLKVDSYGVVDAKAWNAECQHFLDKVIRPRLTDEEALAVAAAGISKIATEMIEVPARHECARIETSMQYDDSMSPTEYERFCALQLDRVGWASELTRASGDQGADVVARKNGAILVVQCKKYSGAVGNSAVQEVVSAKAHLKAHFAAVVSNAIFTPAAVELASNTRTMLLHHSELELVDHRIRQA